VSCYCHYVFIYLLIIENNWSILIIRSLLHLCIIQIVIIIIIIIIIFIGITTLYWNLINSVNEEVSEVTNWNESEDDRENSNDENNNYKYFDI